MKYDEVKGRDCRQRLTEFHIARVLVISREYERTRKLHTKLQLVPRRSVLYLKTAIQISFRRELVNHLIFGLWRVSDMWSLPMRNQLWCKSRHIGLWSVSVMWSLSRCNYLWHDRRDWFWSSRCFLWIKSFSHLHITLEIIDFICGSW